MGKRLPKTKLLLELHHERTRLMELIESIPKRHFNRPGINSAGWSIKDVLTHLVDWEGRVYGWCRTGLAGETPSVPDPQFTWNQTKQLNAAIQKKHQRKSIVRVLAELDEAHEKTLALISELTPRQLTQIGVFDWTGKSWSVSDYLRGSTASHYRWARTKIRKWLAAID
jgi:hypothetical protein